MFGDKSFRGTSPEGLPDRRVRLGGHASGRLEREADPPEQARHGVGGVGKSEGGPDLRADGLGRLAALPRPPSPTGPHAGRPTGAAPARRSPGSRRPLDRAERVAPDARPPCSRPGTARRRSAPRSSRRRAAADRRLKTPDPDAFRVARYDLTRAQRPRPLSSPRAYAAPTVHGHGPAGVDQAFLQKIFRSREVRRKLGVEIARPARAAASVLKADRDPCGSRYGRPSRRRRPA